MISFLKLIGENTIDGYEYTKPELEKLYRFYLYLFRPNEWKFYKFIHRIVKKIKG